MECFCITQKVYSGNHCRNTETESSPHGMAVSPHSSCKTTKYVYWDSTPVFLEKDESGYETEPKLHGEIYADSSSFKAAIKAKVAQTIESRDIPRESESNCISISPDGFSLPSNNGEMLQNGKVIECEATGYGFNKMTAGEDERNTNTPSTNTNTGETYYPTLSMPCNLSRHLLLGIYMLYAFLTGCTYFGWPSIKLALYRSGAYSWNCPTDPTTGEYINDKRNNGHPYICDAQDAAVSPLFTVAMVCHSLMTAGAGTLLDHVGPKKTAIVGQIFNGVAWLLIGYSNQAFPAYIPGMVLLGLGADTGYLPLLSIIRLYSNNSATVISMLGTACTASFGIPYILNIIFGLTEMSHFSDMCLIYVVCGPLFCLLIALIFIPWYSFDAACSIIPVLSVSSDYSVESTTVPTDSGIKSSIGDLESHSRSEESGSEGRVAYESNFYNGSIEICANPITHNFDSERNSLASGITGSSQDDSSQSHIADQPASNEPDTSLAIQCPSDILKDYKAELPSFKSQIFSYNFLCIALYSCAMQIAVSYYQSASDRILVADVADHTDLFISCSFIPCVIIGISIDYYGPLPVLLFMNTMGVLSYVLSFTNHILGLHYVSIISFCMYISLDSEQVYCYIDKTFPPNHFGKLSGIAIATGGIMSLSSIPLYDVVTLKYFQGNVAPVAGIIAILLSLVYIMLIYLCMRKKPQR